MYSVLDDRRHANKVNKVLSVNPNATRKRISELTYLCDPRLLYLHKQGLINLEHTYRRFADDAKELQSICE